MVIVIAVLEYSFFFAFFYQSTGRKNCLLPSWPGTNPGVWIHRTGLFEINSRSTQCLDEKAIANNPCLQLVQPQSVNNIQQIIHIKILKSVHFGFNCDVQSRFTTRSTTIDLSPRRCLFTISRARSYNHMVRGSNPRRGA